MNKWLGNCFVDHARDQCVCVCVIHCKDFTDILHVSFRKLKRFAISFAINASECSKRLIEENKISRVEGDRRRLHTQRLYVTADKLGKLYNLYGAVGDVSGASLYESRVDAYVTWQRKYQVRIVQRNRKTEVMKVAVDRQIAVYFYYNLKHTCLNVTLFRFNENYLR